MTKQNKMTQENQDPVVMLDDKEMKVADLTPKQQYYHSQILDLRNQESRIQFQLDQVTASKSVFEKAFIDSTKEQADEVLETETKTLEN
tara:strand:+ start:47 stop:313 length:267 start_codon:yes stop_codon:yes gene_type:complete